MTEKALDESRGAEPPGVRSIPPVQRFFLTAGGLGLMRPASGTWGSTPPPAMAFLLACSGAGAVSFGPASLIDVCLVLMGLAFSIGCVRFGFLAERATGRKDPGIVVADEVAGQAITLLLLPWRAGWDLDAMLHNALLAGAAFVLFRFFDVLKPPPANALQRIGGGWGILVDDLVAGAMAAIVLQIGIAVLGVG